ncbi:hypothetical protein MRX96_018271 [Rhipicephalus microplus]
MNSRVGVVIEPALTPLASAQIRRCTWRLPQMRALARQLDGLFLGGIRKQLGQRPGQMTDCDESPPREREEC